ncbi:MAG: hypothetical protein DMG82_04995 [Acidobacteria bacterium]|nr:MAG: hypothetical protein DMG82_04995 [Acidobacteriota bacterium]
MSFRLAEGSRILPSSPREFEVKLASGGSSRTVHFDGKRVEVKF